MKRRRPGRRSSPFRADPPRLITRMLAAALPRDPRGRSILGDVLEEWHERPAGLRRTVWYALESMRLAGRYLLVRRRLPSAGASQGPAGASGPKPVIDRLSNDVRQAIRSLRRTPGFTAGAVLILALGIGTATTMFAALRAVLLDDLPVAGSDRLVTLTPLKGSSPVFLDAEELEAVGRESGTVRGIAGAASFGAQPLPLTEEDRPLVLNVAIVTANLFDVLGARPEIGRLLRPGDGEEGAARVTVISYEAWRRDFGGDPGVLGRRLSRTQNLDEYSIVGVAPPGLDYPAGADYWIADSPRSGNPLRVVARLASAATPEAARSEFLSIVDVLDGARTPARGITGATVRQWSDAVTGEARPILVAIAAATGLLLLIACVNVGNLLLMRATRRWRDLRVRRALGATSGDLARLLLMEAALLGVAGGVLGLACAIGLLHALPAFVPAQLPRAGMIGLAAPPVVPALGLTLFSVLVFGVVPAVTAARGSLTSMLRLGGGSGTRHRRRLRRVLVATQVALAVVLLVGAGLLVRTLQRLDGLQLGYTAPGLSIVELGIDRQRHEGPEEMIALLEGALERIRGVPGVTAATLVMSRPFIGATGVVRTRPLLEGQPESARESNPLLPIEVGGRELFRTFGIPVIQGRGLLESDRESSDLVAVVSRDVARRLWPGRDPVGQRMRMSLPRPEWWTVVGVAGETRFRQLREPMPTIYVPWRQLRIVPMAWTVALRTDADFATVLPAIRSALPEFDSRIYVWRARTMDDYLRSGPLALPRTTAALLSAFGMAALFLAAVGLYGVMTLAVGERTHDLGVRMALGATASRLRRSVIRDALSTTVAGSVAGVAIALVVSRLLVSLLFEVSPADPVTLVGVAVVLLAVTVVAAYIPARRATRIDPMDAVRAE